MTHKVTWVGKGRKAECPANPEYPDGIALDMRTGQEIACTIQLPYPAPEVGMWFIECADCRKNVLVTAAGRADDPVSVTLPCGVLQ